MCDFLDDFGWEDFAMAGSLAEEMTEAEREQIRAEQETFELDTDDLGFDKENDY